MKLLPINIFAAVMALGFVSCEKKIDTEGLAARVGDKFLTIEEVEKNIPSSLKGADSIKFSRQYINNWVEEEAMLLMAEKNLPSTAEIEKMVEDYRRQLIIWEYRKRMTLQNSPVVDDDNEITDYYDRHRNYLRLQRPVIKGVYIKISEEAKELPEIRKLYRSNDIKDIDKLEKLLDRAVNYEYFRDKWTDWGFFEPRIPLNTLDSSPDEFPLSHDHIDVVNDGYVYLVDIIDCLPAGEVMPKDFAKEIIVEAIERENAVAYDKLLRKQLTDKALLDGIAQIY